MLNEYEKKKLDIIKKIISKEITVKEATKRIDLSERQIYRLLNAYAEHGEKAFIHGNRGRKSEKKKDVNELEPVKNLYLNKCNDFNFQHFYEEHVSGKYNISYDLMYRYFLEKDIISPLAHKDTVRAYNNRMKEVMKKVESDDNNKKIELFKSRIIEVEKAHPRKANNLYAFGQEVQFDACNKNWFGNISSFLHLAVDKGTKKVLAGWFEYEEITRGYYVVLFNLIINYGIPEKIKADNRSSFSANNIKNKIVKNFLTQFGKVCERLDITLYTTSVPTSKSNVERENKTIKDRLIAELRYEGINNIDEANRYLNEVFIPKINKRFSYVPDEKNSHMRKNTYTEEELKLIISERKEKIIDNASCIKYNKAYYIPIDQETGEVVNYKKGTKCTLIIDYDGNYMGEIENKYYKMLELETRDSIMKKESEVESKNIKKEHHKYIPPKNHPWRKNMMLRNK